MKAQSAMEYLMTYGWALLIVIIVAAALYMLGVFNPETYQQDSQPNENWSNCSAFFLPAKMVYVKDVRAHTSVQHFQDDLDFFTDLHQSHVTVYCYGGTTSWGSEVGTKCGAFNNLGVFQWGLTHCNV